MYQMWIGLSVCHFLLLPLKSRTMIIVRKVIWMNEKQKNQKQKVKPANTSYLMDYTVCQKYISRIWIHDHVRYHTHHTYTLTYSVMLLFEHISPLVFFLSCRNHFRRLEWREKNNMKESMCGKRFVLRISFFLSSSHCCHCYQQR